MYVLCHENVIPPRPLFLAHPLRILYHESEDSPANAWSHTAIAYRGSDTNYQLSIMPISPLSLLFLSLSFSLFLRLPTRQSPPLSRSRFLCTRNAKQNCAAAWLGPALSTPPPSPPSFLSCVSLSRRSKLRLSLFVPAFFSPTGNTVRDCRVSCVYAYDRTQRYPAVS